MVAVSWSLEGDVREAQFEHSFAPRLASTVAQLLNEGEQGFGKLGGGHRHKAYRPGYRHLAW